RADPALAPGRMGLVLAGRLGLPGFGLSGEGAFGDTYVDRTLPAADRVRLRDAAVAAYRAHPQVAAVFTGEALARRPMPVSSPDRWTL
ncbi:hypothetical protein NY593_25330, partial [Enterobacter asburiae]|uniref:hypothetical protein n=1 Tax=Enterobacter asburiae TaxID=61645 RepID=UPI0022F06A05